MLLGLIIHVGVSFLMMTDIKLQRTFTNTENENLKFAGINWELYMSAYELLERRIDARFQGFTKMNIMIYMYGAGSLTFIILLILLVYSCQSPQLFKYWTLQTKKGEPDLSLNYLKEISIDTMKSLYKRSLFDLNDFNNLFAIGSEQ